MTRREWLFLLAGVVLGIALYHMGNIRGLGVGGSVNVGGEG